MKKEVLSELPEKTETTLSIAFDAVSYTHLLSDTLGQPVLVGALLGLLTGQVEQGLMIGGSLELMYLGIIYPGGTVPACASSAALVAIPIALRTGLDAHAATRCV